MIAGTNKLKPGNKLTVDDPSSSSASDAVGFGVGFLFFFVLVFDFVDCDFLVAFKRAKGISSPEVVESSNFVTKIRS